MNHKEGSQESNRDYPLKIKINALSSILLYRGTISSIKLAKMQVISPFSDEKR